MSDLNPHAVHQSSGGKRQWLASVGGSFLVGIDGQTVRRFATKEAAEEAAELDAWLRETPE
jgi:hypothetical protein